MQSGWINLQRQAMKDIIADYLHISAKARRLSYFLLCPTLPSRPRQACQTWSEGAEMHFLVVGKVVGMVEFASTFGRHFKDGVYKVPKGYRTTLCLKHRQNYTSQRH